MSAPRSGTRWLTAAAAVVLLAGAGAEPVRAQATPADTAAILYEAAVELEAAGRPGAAEALLELLLRRYPGTPAAEAARQRLAAGPPAGRRAEGGGRTEVVVWSTLFGLWLGAAVPGALGAESAEAYGVGLLLGGPAGFLAGRLHAENRLRGAGHARAVTLGGTWGTWQAFGWREVLDLAEDPVVAPVCVEPDPERGCLRFEDREVDGEASAETILTTLILGGLAGVVVGDALGARHRPEPGTAAALTFAPLWGSWYGAAAAGMAGVEGGDDVLAWTLVGGNLGLVAAALLAPDRGLTPGRVSLISAAGLAGLMAGLGLDLLIQPGDRMALAIPAATSAAGLYLGARWTRPDSDRTRRGGGGGPEGAEALGPGGGRLTLAPPSLVPAVLTGPGGAPAAGIRLTLLDARF